MIAEGSSIKPGGVMPDIKQEVLEEAKKQLKMNLSVIDMLKRNTPLWAIAKSRDEWVTPLEKLVHDLSEIEKGNTPV